MRADEFFPRRRLLALRSWSNAMALEDVPHGLDTDGVSVVGQGADDPVVAPGAIFLCHAYHQRLQLLVDRGAPWGRAPLGTVTLRGHERAVQAENRIGLDDLGHFRQRLLPPLVADLSQGLPLAVTQPHASLDLVAEDTIFRDQI